MRYLSIDIETTGLDRFKNHLLEIGIVADSFEDGCDINKPQDPYIFHAYIDPGCDPWKDAHPKAIKIHKESGLYDKWQNAPGSCIGFQNVIGCKLHIDRLANEVLKWVRRIGMDENRLNIAGKNVASFDLPWLYHQVPYWKVAIKGRHRNLDPGMLYLRADDTAVPNLSDCLERAGLEDTVTHNALDDAKQVASLIRKHFVMPTMGN